MSNLAHYLQNSLHDENIMERAMNEIMRKEYNISNDIEISYSLINTAQQTLSDLDKSIDELSNFLLICSKTILSKALSPEPCN